MIVSGWLLIILIAALEFTILSPSILRSCQRVRPDHDWCSRFPNDIVCSFVHRISLVKLTFFPFFSQHRDASMCGSWLPSLNNRSLPLGPMARLGPDNLRNGCAHPPGPGHSNGKLDIHNHGRRPRRGYSHTWHGHGDPSSSYRRRHGLRRLHVLLFPHLRPSFRGRHRRRDIPERSQDRGREARGAQRDGGAIH